VEHPKLELRPGDGVLYKFFEDYRLLRADVVLEGSFQEGDLVVAHHPDPDLEPLRYRLKRVWRQEDKGLWCFTASLLGEVPSWGKRPTPKIHDYTDGVARWGHDLAQRTKGGRAIGWGVGLREGDLLLVSKPDTTYIIESVKYTDDPPDMWFATVKEKKDG
jgi:hypothetical protein